jgi:hypothetical protein
MSMPRVFRSEMEAMHPRRESSAATKYSPDTPASRDGIRWPAPFDDFAIRTPILA